MDGTKTMINMISALFYCVNFCEGNKRWHHPLDLVNRVYTGVAPNVHSRLSDRRRVTEKYLKHTVLGFGQLESAAANIKKLTY